MSRSSINIEVMWIGAILLALVLSIPVVIYFGVAYNPQPERVYYTRYGAAVCQQMDRTACGVSLRKCHNGKIYECLQDVSYEDITP